MPYPYDRFTRPPYTAVEILAMIRTENRMVPEAPTTILQETIEFGDITVKGGGDVDLNSLVETSEGIIRIDATAGTATTYGELTPAPNGSQVIFSNSAGVYVAGTAQIYLNQQEQIKGTDFTESAPDTGGVTMAIAPDATDILILSYHQNEFTPLLAYATSDTDNANLQITGLINGSNKVYTLPSLGKSGTWKVFLNGGLQTQGTGEDYTETTSSTFTFIVAPTVPDVVSATYEREGTDRRFENTDGTLTYNFDGINTRGTTTSPYAPGALELSWQGQLLTPGADYIETDPAAGAWDVTDPKAGDVLAAAYTVGSNAVERGERTRNTTATSSITMNVYDRSVIADATSGDIIITLPPVADTEGMEFNIIKINSNSNDVTLEGVVNGVTDPVMGLRNDSWTMRSDGSTGYYLV